MTYRGVEYNPQSHTVEAVWDGRVLTYKGVEYQRKVNQLEQVRKFDKKQLRYRGAQLAMAKA